MWVLWPKDVSWGCVIWLLGAIDQVWEVLSKDAWSSFRVWSIRNTREQSGSAIKAMVAGRVQGLPLFIPNCQGWHMMLRYRDAPHNKTSTWNTQRLVNLFKLLFLLCNMCASLCFWLGKALKIRFGGNYHHRSIAMQNPNLNEFNKVIPVGAAMRCLSGIFVDAPRVFFRKIFYQVFIRMVLRTACVVRSYFLKIFTVQYVNVYMYIYIYICINSLESW